MSKVTLVHVLEYESVAVISISEYQSADPLQDILPHPATLWYLHLLNLSSFFSVRPTRKPVVYHEKEKSYLKGWGGLIVKAERSPEEEPITTVRVD